MWKNLNVETNQFITSYIFKKYSDMDFEMLSEQKPISIYVLI